MTPRIKSYSQYGRSIAVTDKAGLWHGVVDEYDRPRLQRIPLDLGRGELVNSVATNGDILVALVGTLELWTDGDPHASQRVIVIDTTTEEVQAVQDLEFFGAEIALVGTDLYSWGWYCQADILDVFHWGDVCGKLECRGLDSDTLQLCEIVAPSSDGRFCGTRRYANEFVVLDATSGTERVLPMPEQGHHRTNAHVGFDLEDRPVYTRLAGNQKASWLLDDGKWENIGTFEGGSVKGGAVFSSSDGAPVLFRSKSLPAGAHAPS